MSEENLNNSQENSTSQIDVARELNSVLEQVSNKLEKIQKLTMTQTDFIHQMAETFSQMTNIVGNMSESASEIGSSLEEVSNQVAENFSEQNMQDLNDGLTQVANSAERLSSVQTKSLEDVNEKVSDMGSVTTTINNSMKKSTSAIDNSLKNAGKAVSSFSDSASKISKETSSFSEAIEKLKTSIDSMLGGYSQMIKDALSLGLSATKAVFSIVSSFIGTAAKFTKFALTMPFTITQAAANIGYKIRKELVEVIQTATEALKDKFDMDSDIGKGISAMSKRGKGMLIAFENPTSELVKLFGFGSAGIANMIGFMGENISAMGHYSEVFGKSLTKNQSRLMNFTKMVKGLGFSAEDIAYISQDAGVNLKHINVRMAELGVTLENTSKEFGVDRKRLSKNFMILKKDITQFGHLSDEELSRTTARLTQMRVKLEDASAVFKKFSTFEDAANSVAMLSQTFGMNLDAMDIIQAKNPEDIINMFRNSMLETGRSFQDLNRFEKDLMAQHTGMSAESLSALMNYRDLGLTHQEAVSRMESEKPTSKQMKSLKQLNSAIKEVQKVLQFDSPFKAFFTGLSKNTALTGDFKNAVTSLSKGYEGIYKFALELKPETWEGLIEPIVMIVNAMKSILQSQDFKDGLVGALATVSKFVGTLFGITKGDSILDKLKTNAGIGFGKGGVFYKNKDEKKKFNKFVFEAVENKDKQLNYLFSKDILKELKKIKDPVKLLERLQELKSSVSSKKSGIHSLFDKMFKEIAKKVDDEYGNDEKQNTKRKIKTKDTVNDLAAGLTEVIKNNKNNVSKLFSLSGRVAGAMLKGGAIGFTALLKTINTQLKKRTTSTEAPKEDSNMIEDFLGFNKGEFNTLTTELTSALLGFLDNSEGAVGIFGWLIAGIKDVFELVGGFFYNTLKGAINGLMGLKDQTSLSESVKGSSSKLVRPKLSKTSSNISESLEKGDYIENKDTAHITHDFIDILKSIKTGDDQVRKSLLASAVSLKDRMSTGNLYREDAHNVAADFNSLGKILSDGNTNNDADALKKASKVYSEFIKKLDARDAKILKDNRYSTGTSFNPLTGGSKIKSVEYNAENRGMSDPQVLKKIYEENRANETDKSGYALVGGILGTIGLGAAYAFLASNPVGWAIGLAGALGGAAGSGLGYGTGAGVQSIKDSSDISGPETITTANDFGIINMSAIQKLFDSDEGIENVKNNLQKETIQSYASVNLDDKFNQNTSLPVKKSNKISREKYDKMYAEIKKNAEIGKEPLMLDSLVNMSYKDMNELVKMLVGPYKIFEACADPAKAQGNVQPRVDSCQSPTLNVALKNQGASEELVSLYG